MEFPPCLWLISEQRDLGVAREGRVGVRRMDDLKQSRKHASEYSYSNVCVSDRQQRIRFIVDALG